MEPTDFTPTPGFEFPQSAQDKVDQALRNVVNPNKQDVKSVRPDRMAQIEQRNARARGHTPVIPEVVTGQPAQTSFLGAQRQLQAPTQTQPSNEVVQNSTGNPASAAYMQPRQVTGVIKNEEPPTTPMSSADAVSISLPSRFAYYKFKDLYAKPFRVPHLAKMAKVEASGSLQLLAETVSSVLQTPIGTKDIALKLSMADLSGVLYWLRVNSFTSKSTPMPYVCENPAHLEAVQAGHKHPDTLEGKQLVDLTQVEVTELESIPDPEIYHLIVKDEDREVRIDLRPELVSDAIQFLELPDWFNEDVQYIAKVASVLDLESAIPDLHWTLKLKMKFVEEVLTTDQVMLVQEFMKLTDEFGVKEVFDYQCKECGASGRARLTIDARTFLTQSK